RSGVKLTVSWSLSLAGGTGGDVRSWLLLKHRDEWAGPLDIAEFAPLSVKSGGDLADILAADNPDVWQSHRPAKGGDTGAMFARIIERAMAIKQEREGTAPPAAAPTAAAKTKMPATKKKAAARKADVKKPTAAKKTKRR